MKEKCYKMSEIHSLTWPQLTPPQGTWVYTTQSSQPSTSDQDSGTENLEQKTCTDPLAEYWIDPNGRIWSIDYSGTHDFEDLGRFKICKNGNKGRISPFTITKQIEVYPAVWKTHYAPTPVANVNIVEGVVQKILYSGN